MKLRERVIICSSITFVLFTLLLFIDLQFDIGYTGHRFLLPTRHGRVEMLESMVDGDRSIFRNFQNRFGGGGGGGEYTAENVVSEGTSVKVTEHVAHDPFTDLEPFANINDTSDLTGNTVVFVVNEDRKMEANLAMLLNLSG